MDLQEPGILLIGARLECGCACFVPLVQAVSWCPSRMLYHSYTGARETELAAHTVLQARELKKGPIMNT